VLKGIKESIYCLLGMEEKFMQINLSEETIKTVCRYRNSISTVYVPKPGCTKNTIKWYDDSKLIKKIK
jgi:hypothetical protein